MDITGYRPHTLHARVKPAEAQLQFQTRQPQLRVAQRIERPVIRRVNEYHERQPRVRLSRHIDETAYVHWQDYIDIADNHLRAQLVVTSTPAAQSAQHETMSEMLDRYRSRAQRFSDKLSQWFQTSYYQPTEAQTFTPDQSIN